MSADTGPTQTQAVVRLDRMRLAEWIMLLASIGLIIDIVAFPWYSIRSIYETGLNSLGQTQSNISIGTEFHILAPLAIVCVMLAWGTCIAQVVDRGPALPLALTVIATFLDLILVIGLLIRVVFDQPSTYSRVAGTPNELKPDVASVAGLFLAAILLYGAWRSLRTDGIAAADSPERIETLRLAPRSR